VQAIVTISFLHGFSENRISNRHTFSIENNLTGTTVQNQYSCNSKTKINIPVFEGVKSIATCVPATP